MNLCEYRVCLESSIFLFQMTRKKNQIKTINISVVHHVTLFLKVKLLCILYLVGHNWIFPPKTTST